MHDTTSTSDEPTPEPRETRSLVDAIASEFWALHGRGGTLNWRDVERHLGTLVSDARRDVRRGRVGPR